MKEIAKIFSCFVLSSVLSSPVFASLDLERSAESCEKELLERADSLSSPDAKSRVLMPLSTFFLSTKDPFLALLWRIADTVVKEGASPGLQRLINSASLAVEAILEDMPEARGAVRPSYPTGNLAKGYEATQRLILSERPEYIRDAVLIRNGVVTVVPLLKRVVKNSGKTNFPVYIPIIVRGHQDIESWDIFAASFASWALEPIQGQVSPEALIYNKPMQKVRKQVQKQIAPFSRVNPRVHIPHLERATQEIVEIFDSYDVAKSLEPERSTYSSRSPYISFIKELLDKRKSLWMVPMPPNSFERGRLAELGYGDTDLLAKLEINSVEFFQAAAETGIDPDRLRRYVARSRAKAEKRKIVVQDYANPLLDARGRKKWRLHVDFEDITEPQIRGGIYLIGWAIESPNGKIVERGHFFADKKDQSHIDDVMADLFRLANNNRRIAGKDFVVTVYSHHEQVKIMQSLDMVEDKPETFSAAQRKSKYYTEVNLGTEEDPDLRGRLIQNTDFFEAQYKDLEPKDVFVFLDRMVDLLPFLRNNIFTHEYTNSLKKIVTMFSTDEFHVNYPPGHNGLEVGVWVGDYWETGNPKGRENAIFYVHEDVTGNIIAARAIDDFAGRPVDADFLWDEKVSGSLEQYKNAIGMSRSLVYLRLKEKLLEKIFEKNLVDLDEATHQELLDCVDMSDYLASRKLIRDDNTLTDLEKARILQQKKVEFEDVRASKLIALFEKANPKLKDRDHSKDLNAAVSEILHVPSVYLRETHIEKMIVLDQVYSRTPEVSPFTEIGQSLDLPEEWEKAYKDFADTVDAGEAPWKGWKEPLLFLKRQTYRDVWRSIYYAKFFQLAHAGKQ